MKVRRYEERDLDAVVRVFTRAVQELATEHYDEKQRAAWAPEAPDMEAWRERLRNRNVLVAEAPPERDGDVGAIMGFVAYEGNGHIDLLFTAPECARKGIASLLYEGAEAELAASGVTTLTTDASAVARPLFEEHGFHVMEEETVERGGEKLVRFAMKKVRGGVG